MASGLGFAQVVQKRVGESGGVRAGCLENAKPRPTHKLNTSLSS